MNWFREIYLTNRFFYLLSGIGVLFIPGMLWPFFFFLGYTSVAVFTIMVAVDLYLLFSRSRIPAERHIATRFSNGDANTVEIKIENPYPFAGQVTVIDEAPVEFQLRNLRKVYIAEPGEIFQYSYHIIPTKRGQYSFGRILAYYQTPLRLLERVMVTDTPQTVNVYPAFHNLSQYELMALADQKTEMGSRQVRAESLTLEFDQIRDYTIGDDTRLINWAATARRGKTMVNQYQEERSQSIYSVIDMGRSMEMPFNGMTLLDYAINAGLALSKVALIKQDKPGLITYSNRIKNIVKADGSRSQMSFLMEALYHQKTAFQESNMNALYVGLRTILPSRSTLILYTNLETILSIKRVLPVLKYLNKRHLLLLILFRNTEIESMSKQPSETLSDIYDKAIAEDHLLEKHHIEKALHKAGIRTILTKPETLTVETINQYLAIKRRRMV